MPNIHHYFDFDRPLAHLTKTERSAQHKFALVRNPIDRLYSAYSNKILDNRLFEDRLHSKPLPDGLPARPSFDDFVFNLEQYLDLSPFLAMHCLPFVDYLGADPKVFSEIRDISETQKICGSLRKQFGFSALPARLNETGSGRADISRSTVKRIKTIYAADFEAFGHIFKRSSHPVTGSLIDTFRIKLGL